VNKNNRKFTLVGLGEILWDMLPDGKQLGGAPANFAYHAQALGAQGIVVSCVGDDELGKEIIRRLEALDLEPRYIAMDKSHPTGTVTVELDENGKPDYNIHENVAWDFIPSQPAVSKLAGFVDAVCFGSLCQRCKTSGSTIGNFLRATKSGCIRVFDINLRQNFFSKEIILKTLELSDILKLSDEELPVIADMLGLGGSETAIVSQLADTCRLRMVALTRGPKGSLLYAGGESCNHPGFRTEIADTVGAGDAFAAAITLGLLHGKTLDEINEFANRLASFVCSRPGATPQLPDSLTQEFGLS